MTWGVLLGLVVGKSLGVIVATRGMMRFGLADAPAGASWRQILGIGSAAAIGFTVALSITELAFTDPKAQSDAREAILLASLLAAITANKILIRRPETEATIDLPT